MTEERVFEVAPGEEYVDDRSRMTIFFQVLVKKFWKLINVNFMYMIFNIPAIIVSFILSVFILNAFFPYNVVSISQDEMWVSLFAIGIPVCMFLMVVPVISVGPAQAGMSYLLRCFSYEMPTFNWSDFKDKMRDNFKQGILVSFINLFVLVFAVYDLYLYSQLNLTNNILFPIANGLLVSFFVIFLMMNLYIYPMMVNYHIKNKYFYKNAFLFAFAKLLPNFGVLLLCFILIIGPVLLGMYI